MQDNVLRGSTGHALVRAFRLINRRFGAAAKHFGISAEQVHILLTLWSEGPMTVGALQRAVSLSGPTLTGALQRLEEGGQVRRVRDEQDRRAWRVEAIPWDARRRGRLVEVMRAEEDACFATLTATERRQLHELLSRLVRRLDEEEAATPRR